MFVADGRRGNVLHAGRPGDPFPERLVQGQACQLLEDAAKRVEAPVVVVERFARCMARAGRSGLAVVVDRRVIDPGAGGEQIVQGCAALCFGQRQVDLVDTKPSQRCRQIDEAFCLGDAVEHPDDALAHGMQTRDARRLTPLGDEFAVSDDDHRRGAGCFQFSAPVDQKGTQRDVVGGRRKTAAVDQVRVLQVDRAGKRQQDGSNDGPAFQGASRFSLVPDEPNDTKSTSSGG